MYEFIEKNMLMAHKICKSGNKSLLGKLVVYGDNGDI
jgi:hypothetical protein